jgi:hypothetical protein
MKTSEEPLRCKLEMQSKITKKIMRSIWEEKFLEDHEQDGEIHTMESAGSGEEPGRLV